MVMAVTTMAALSFLFASLLVLAHRKLHVDEDPRIETTHAEDEREVIAQFLGVDVGAEEKVVARLACAGGTNVARNHARYEGVDSCRAATLVAGGGKGCFWGCLGLGDCAAVCDLDAIVLDEHELPVVIEDKCTACGDCVDACPKDLFSLHPVSHRLWVACKNLQQGDAVLEECEVGCDACGRCAVDAPAGVVSRGARHGKSSAGTLDPSRQPERAVHEERARHL